MMIGVGVTERGDGQGEKRRITGARADACTYGYLLRRARQELAELERAIHAGKPADEVLSEAADVANFCLMIADNYAARKEEQATEAASVRSSF